MSGSTGRIAVLPDELQAQIAAGEVVERPASIVKELVENALDAGAHRIEVEIVQGGLELLRVRDDGCGMVPDDALRAFGRHATSKLRRLDELTGVATHGFRGEALPSIAAAGSVRLVSRAAMESHGTAVEAVGTTVVPCGPTGAPQGTTVEVRDLFAQTPVRRKFMRAPGTEATHVVDVVTHMAMVRPDVAFRVVRDGREVLALPSASDLRGRAIQILGRQRGEQVVLIDSERQGIRVAGLLGVPRESFASARLVWTYVRIDDGAARWVRDRLLLRAAHDGYASLLMHGRHPLAIVIVSVPTGDVDVNVHPQKLEVRFRRSQEVYQAVAGLIRARLEDALKPPVPLGDTHDTVGGRPYPAGGLVVDDGPATSGPSPVAGVTVVRDAPRALDAQQAVLWRPAPEGFSRLRFVGQLFDGYLLCEGPERAVLIDQHAAHERVQFERLRREHAEGRVLREALLVPELVTLPPTQVAFLAEHGDALAAAGLEGEPFGDDGYLVRTMPQLLRGHDIGHLVRLLASEGIEDGASRAAWNAQEHVLATMACHSAIRVGQRLDEARVRALLAAMDGVDVNAHCPHGRPVTVDLSRTHLEGLFRR